MPMWKKTSYIPLPCSAFVRQWTHFRRKTRRCFVRYICKRRRLPCVPTVRKTGIPVMTLHYRKEKLLRLLKQQI